MVSLTCFDEMQWSDVPRYHVEVGTASVAPCAAAASLCCFRFSKSLLVNLAILGGTQTGAVERGLFRDECDGCSERTRHIARPSHALRPHISYRPHLRIHVLQTRRVGSRLLTVERRQNSLDPEEQILVSVRLSTRYKALLDAFVVKLPVQRDRMLSKEALDMFGATLLLGQRA